MALDRKINELDRIPKLLDEQLLVVGTATDGRIFNVKLSELRDYIVGRKLTKPTLIITAVSSSRIEVSLYGDVATEQFILRLALNDNFTNVFRYATISAPQSTYVFTGLTANTQFYLEAVAETTGWKPSDAFVQPVKTGIPKTARVNIWAGPGQSNDSGLSPRTGLALQYFNTDNRIKSFKYHDNDENNGVPSIVTYSLGTMGPDGWPINASDHGITKRIVPSYDNGFGPDVGYVHAWKQDPDNTGKELFIFKKDLTPPVSTNSSTVAYWQSTLYSQFLAEWNAFKALLLAQDYTTVIVENVFIGLGEGDSDTGNSNYKNDLYNLLLRFYGDGIYNVTSTIWIVLKERPQYNAIRLQQLQLIAEHSSYFKSFQVSNPTYLSDNVHEDQATMLRKGAEQYAAVKALSNPMPVMNGVLPAEIPMSLI